MYTHGDNVWCVKVNNAFEVWSGGMDGRMEHKTGDVDTEVGRARLDDAALHVDLYQAGGRDLVVEHAERVEQEVLSVLTNANLKSKRVKIISMFKITLTLRS